MFRLIYVIQNFETIIFNAGINSSIFLCNVVMFVTLIFLRQVRSTHCIPVFYFYFQLCLTAKKLLAEWSWWMNGYVISGVFYNCNKNCMNSLLYCYLSAPAPYSLLPTKHNSQQQRIIFILIRGRGCFPYCILKNMPLTLLLHICPMREVPCFLMFG